MGGHARDSGFPAQRLCLPKQYRVKSRQKVGGRRFQTWWGVKGTKERWDTTQDRKRQKTKLRNERVQKQGEKMDRKKKRLKRTSSVCGCAKINSGVLFDKRRRGHMSELKVGVSRNVARSPSPRTRTPQDTHVRTIMHWLGARAPFSTSLKIKSLVWTKCV